MRAYIRRYRTVALLSLFVILGALWLQPQPVKPANAASPTPVHLTQAVVLDQGVHIKWQPGQAGSHPVAGYLIERRRHNGFEQIARVEAWSSSYLDADGHIGDTYRIIAEDGQHKPNRSAASDSIVAIPAKPGDTVVRSTYSPQVLGASETSDQAKSAAEKVTQLSQELSKGFTSLDEALGRNATASVSSHLNALQEYQRQALSLLPQLSPSQKKTLAQTCADHMPVLETNLHRMIEADQLDGMLVLAGCNALTEGTL